MIGQSNYQNLDQLIWSRRQPVTTAKCLVRADQCLGLGSVSPSCRPQWSEAPCHLRPYLDPKFKLIQRYCKHYAPWRYCSMISLSNNANLEAHYVSSIYKKATANMDDWRGYTDLNLYEHNYFSEIQVTGITILRNLVAPASEKSWAVPPPYS